MLTANKTRRSDNAGDQVLRKTESLAFVSASPTYPFSFPLCDLLICEFDAEEASVTNLYTVTKVTRHQNSRTATFPDIHVAVRGALSVAEYILQKVVRRKPVPFLKSQKDLKNLGCYVVETLECGHEVEVYPSDIEPLTARKRNCHECSGWMGGFQIGKRKAPASVKGTVRKRKVAGESPWWSVGFAVGCASLLIAGIFYCLTPEDLYHVLDRQSDLSHTIQMVHRGKVLPSAVMFWCDPQDLEAGHTLTSFKFRYIREKYCYVVDSFSLLRDAAKCPVVPSNCWHTDCAHPDIDHVLCNGVPKFD